jgi:hypothetical protein
MGYDAAQSARLAIMPWENSTGEGEKDVAAGQVLGALLEFLIAAGSVQPAIVNSDNFLCRPDVQ